MVATKSKLAGNQQILAFFNDFLHHFVQWCNDPRAPVAADLEKFLARNFALNTNNKIVCKSLVDYVQRISGFRKAYSHVEIVGPLQEPLVCEGNKIVLNYELDLRSHQGEKSRFYVMAIATLADDKIASWQQISHNCANELDYIAKHAT